MNRSKRPWTCGGCALTTFAVLLVLFFITAITSWLWFQSSERKLAAQARSQIESLREQGIPVDNASLDKWYRSRTNGEDSQAWVRINDPRRTRWNTPPEIPANSDEYTASRIRGSLWIFGE